MIDEFDKFYEDVAREVGRGFVEPGLMARSIAESGGDRILAPSLYLRYRVREQSRAQRAAEARARMERECDEEARAL